MAIVIYVYAILGYELLATQFQVGDYPTRDQAVCTSLFMCFASIITEGLRGGDVGSFMEPLPSPDIIDASHKDPHETFLFWFQSVYQLSFWFIVITVLLNVIFGIIIDSFGSLREKNLSIKHNMENTVCYLRCALTMHFVGSMAMPPGTLPSLRTTAFRVCLRSASSVASIALRSTPRAVDSKSISRSTIICGCICT